MTENHKINAPWGTLSFTGNDAFPGAVAFWIKQLQYFKQSGLQRSCIDKDIEGYEYLLLHGSNELMFKFLKKKKEMENRSTWTNNMKVIKAMIDEGMFE